MSEAFDVYRRQIEDTPTDSRNIPDKLSQEYEIGTMMVQRARGLDDGWRSQAACSDENVDPDLFFSDVGGNDNSTKKAIKICESCPVQQECLNYALVNNENFGVWGGKTERQRMQLKYSAKRRRMQSLK